MFEIRMCGYIAGANGALWWSGCGEWLLETLDSASEMHDKIHDRNVEHGPGSHWIERREVRWAPPSHPRMHQHHRLQIS